MSTGMPPKQPSGPVSKPAPAAKPAQPAPAPAGKPATPPPATGPAKPATPGTATPQQK